MLIESYGRPILRYSREERREVSARSFGYCIYCGYKTEPTTPVAIDHLIPLRKDGPHGIENCFLACRSCNSSKSDRSLDEFRHNCAIKKLGWPNVSRKTIEWARGLGADLSAYDEFGFWFERSPMKAARRTRALVANLLEKLSAQKTHSVSG